MGNFEVTLREDLVPMTVNNFIDLTHANFYDGLIFHRVIAGFMNQDGCPLGNGTGGPGYTFDDEFHPELRHDSAGILSMANSGPNTNGSQYFITAEATSWLDDVHSVFGKVSEGLDIVLAINQVETDANDKPLVDVVIDSIRIKDLHIENVLNDFTMTQLNEVIDLNDYFSSYESLPIDYIVSSSNSSVINAVVTDNLLSLEVLESDIVTSITVTGTTNGVDSISLEFEVAHFLPKPIAGFGNDINFEMGYLNCGNHESLNNFETISIAGFVKFSDLIGNQGIISKSSSTSNGWYLSYNESNSKLKFYIRSQSNQNRKVYSTTEFTEINRYYFVVCTYDGYNCNIYIDGELDNTKSYTDFSGINNNITDDLIIGKVVSSNLNGSLDNFSLWNKALSINEILDLRSKVIIETENNLIGSWTFDEDFGNTTNDITTNNDGIFNFMSFFSFNENYDLKPIFYTNTETELESVLPSNYLEDGYEFIIVDDVTEGNLVVNNITTGEFTYTPNSQFSGLDSFSYKIFDGSTYYSETINSEIYVGDYVGIDKDNYQLSIVNYQLKQNYPNPFNPTTKIRYAFISTPLNALKTAQIVVHNAIGQKIWFSPIADHGSLVTGSCTFDGSSFNSGIYYYSLVVDGKKMNTKAMLLIK